ncbi:MAG TPA: indolepyruvate ferredoxin oxidoreductase subunit alpha [Coriobacteriia bacterium]|nr:indolepyruvate ferredoxin oxidoreductase subunit alpha [Coriobacteriia bacterium]
MTRILLSGNEAIAQGAWEAGAHAGLGYPGTPSTETLERFATLPGVYAEWAPNEKVALEVAAGVSLAGKRSLVTMKHVGLNVAADPLFTLAYTGVRGGIVILVADDPGMHSSQNEQDSHNYAAFARVPMLDPSDSQEALAFAKAAFELSERFDLPVLIRSTVRVSHAKSLVETGVRVEQATPADYRTDPAKWVMMPAMARARRIDLDKRMAAVGEWVEDCDFNREEMRDTALGIVCSGVSYQYVREAAPEASVLKLGVTYPLATETIRRFAQRVDKLVVIEEADAYLARSMRAAGIDISELELPKSGELSPGAIRRALGEPEPALREEETSLPPRPPLMCPGCPHRPVFDALRKLRAVVSGDIGCYTLGALKPLAAMDSCVDMGASIGMAHGIEVAGGVGERPVVAVIGDSTFAHSGITGVVNTVYNGGAGTILILDNRITAMTGHQGNPVNGITLQNRPSHELDLVALLQAIGVPRIRVEDPHNLDSVASALAEETAAEELSVIVFKAPCALLVREKGDPYAVDEDACTKCAVCVKLGCPAIGRDERSRVAYIDTGICVGCGQCVQVCKYGAIVHTGPSCDLGGVS